MSVHSDRCQIRLLAMLIDYQYCPPSSRVLHFRRIFRLLFATRSHVGDSKTTTINVSTDVKMFEYNKNRFYFLNY